LDNGIVNLLTVEIRKEGIREGRGEQTGAHLMLDEDKKSRRLLHNEGCQEVG
jgi:hypothetical protein